MIAIVIDPARQLDRVHGFVRPVRDRKAGDAVAVSALVRLKSFDPNLLAWPCLGRGQGRLTEPGSDGADQIAGGEDESHGQGRACCGKRDDSAAAEGVQPKALPWCTQKTSADAHPYGNAGKSPCPGPTSKGPVRPPPAGDQPANEA